MYILKSLPDLSRSFVKKIIDSGGVRVNGEIPKKAGDLVRDGDTVDITIPEPESARLLPEDIDITILYEDESLAVIEKPAGIVVHPSLGHPSGTLVNALLGQLKTLSSEGGITRPGIVHRLDKETSGLMIVAKDDAAHRRLARQFSLHSISRKYRGILFGILAEKAGEISTHMGRHPKHRKKMGVLSGKGKKAITRYRVLEERKEFSLVEFTLHTGRTHQIRVHSSYLGHPVVGDRVYSNRSRVVTVRDSTGEREHVVHRNLLHAFHIGFRHPVSETPLEFTIDDPSEFSRLWQFLE